MGLQLFVLLLLRALQVGVLPSKRPRLLLLLLRALPWEEQALVLSLLLSLMLLSLPLLLLSLLLLSLLLSLLLGALASKKLLSLLLLLGP